ncbi:hypothetical protein P879_10102 [Paragonimus westermani]|uniref:Helicase ATP-binding domain-containing protein n=1 Tax=Paragonimus westermani TaxID=34504 RepID=A0A8T0D7Z0_9TREM|nr:hypothetical protein P879_10102 [Paragonimus westermani]
MDWSHNFLALCGFLEHSNAETDWQSSLHKPLPLFPPTAVDFGYHTSISRNLETGEISFADQNCITYDLFSEGHGEKAVNKDPLSMRDVINLNDELHRRLKNTFTLGTASVPGDSQDASRLFEEQEILEHMLSSTSLSGIIASGLTNVSSEVDQPNFRHLEVETKLLLMKRMRQAEPVKRYAVLEDTSQQLPQFSVLIKDPAYTWPFELDTFQKQAILCLERNQSVFVAAHTSAGKTVVAEYASAMCRRRGSRVIYTSPIKALSNQKFHDFRKTFGNDVGLLTGDIKVATDSSLLVMTTEILYNMLCSAADAIRDLEVVIMDEVHYLNDAERGHVWEQIMIMLPKHVLLVMLSATVPNTLEFADWLGRIRDSEIHVVATDRRPVPLEHYLFTGLDGQSTDQHLHLLVDQNGNFRPSGYNQAISTYKASKLKKLPKPPGENSRAEELVAAGRGQGSNSGSKPAKAFTGGKANTPGRWNYMPSSDAISVREKRMKTMWLGVVRMLQEQKLMPAIAFGFSRNSLEVLARHLSSVDLLSKSEKNQVRQFLRLSIKKRLKGPDARLPSVLFITDLVLRGLAVHHAGMLPLLKETVEMLFQHGLVRLLFATETFAMGVNMPARCVLFSTLEKFDGRRHRPLNPGNLFSRGIPILSVG